MEADGEVTGGSPSMGVATGVTGSNHRRGPREILLKKAFGLFIIEWLLVSDEQMRSVGMQKRIVANGGKKKWLCNELNVSRVVSSIFKHTLCTCLG